MNIFARTRPFLAVVMALLPMVGACRQIVGIEPRQVSPPVCGLPASGKAACDACMLQNCCPQAQQCGDADGCPGVEACVHACASGDSACWLKCAGAEPAATQAQATVAICRGSACAADCLPDRWTCLGRVKWQTPIAATQPITIRTRVIDYANQQPASDVRGRLCAVTDPNCDSPLASGQSDAQGQVSLSFVWSTRFMSAPQPVFIELHKEGFVEALVTLGTPPPYFDMDAGDWGISTLQALDEYVGSVQAVRDPTRAIVGLGVVDCNFQLAGGVRLTAADGDAPRSTTFYADPNSVPNLALTETVDGGPSGIMNLLVNASGRARLEAHLAATGRAIGTTDIVVRAGAVSNTLLTPTL